MTQTPGPSITSQPRTDDTHWLTMAGYVVLGSVVTAYLCWTIFAPSTSPYSFWSGTVLAFAGLLSFFAYLALFRDTVHLSHTEIEWQPYWLWYFIPGFGIPLAVRAVTPAVLGTGSPLVIVYSLVFATTLVCGVYLYRRRQYPV